MTLTDYPQTSVALTTEVHFLFMLNFLRKSLETDADIAFHTVELLRDWLWMAPSFSDTIILTRSFLVFQSRGRELGQSCTNFSVLPPRNHTCHFCLFYGSRQITVPCCVVKRCVKISLDPGRKGNIRKY